MVAFTHADAGTPEAEWAASGVAALAELPLDAAELAARTFVVIAAHPDDETLGAGGLMRKLHAAGADVRVLLCTAGEASHPDSPSTTPEQLAAVRLAEFGSAVPLLAPAATWTYLKLPDGQLAAHTDSIAGSILDAVAASRKDPENVVLVAPYRSDGHTDHDSLGALAARMAQGNGYGLLEFPIWYWLWANPAVDTWRSWVRVPLSRSEQHAKAQAMRAHASQTEPLSELPGDEVLLSDAFQEHFARPWETFAWHPSQRGTNSAADAERIFDEVHNREDDPWNYTTSWYERRKRALTLAALPQETYASALEIGCSIGTLTEALAPRCQDFLGVDASSAAVSQATTRLEAFPSAHAKHLTLPREWPSGTFDLIVLSEVGYYFSPEELAGLLAHINESTRPGGTLLLCHWRHPISGWELDATSVHAMARQQLGWPTHGLYEEKDFVVEILLAPDAAP